MASLRCVQAARSKRSIRLNFMVMLFFGVLHYPTLLPRNATWHAPALIQCQLCQKNLRGDTQVCRQSLAEECSVRTFHSASGSSSGR